MDLKNILRKFIYDIENTFITLDYLEFKSNDHIIGNLDEKFLKRELQIEKVETILTEVHTKDEENIHKALIIKYWGNFSDSLIKENQQEHLDLIKVKFVYSLRLHFSQENIFFSLEESNQKKLLEIFINTTGKLMIFPYIRHLIHMLSFEAGLNLPPLKPLIVK